MNEVNGPVEKTQDAEVTMTPVASTAKKGAQISIILVSILIGVTLVGATYFYTQSLNVKEPNDLTQTEEDSIWRPDQDLDDAIPLDYIDDGPNTFLQQLENSTIAQYDLLVDWLPRPVETTFDEIPYSVGEWSFSRIYKVGTVKNGTLADTPVYLIYEFGPSEHADLYAVNEQAVIKVRKWIKDITNLPPMLGNGLFKLKSTLDEQFSLGVAFVDIEEMSSDSGIPISKVDIDNGSEASNVDLYRYRQCFFVRTPSDLVAEYTVDIPFIEDSAEGGYGTPVITFTRTDGETMSAEYEIYDRVDYGCGSLCSPLKVVERPDTDFAKLGTTENGHDLFALKNTNDQMLIDLYNEPNTRAFVDTTEGLYEPLKNNKYSYDQFLNMAPIVFWKDQLGRWVKFIHSEFLVLAEKCKPVIYLYPEKETDLHVEVKPNVGFTKTIPEYKDGWKVTAFPDGTIIDKETQQRFDYLYWTGWVEGYPLIEQGWVVAQKDLSVFFDTYLPKYGLVGKEIDDFKDYWVNDMNEAPYYAVTFVDQAVIDELSPLAVDVAPDTVIRVLMTATPLERPIKLNPPRVPETPVRHGFTVAEWGGTILRTE